jgi:2-aminoadipate transaminase
MKLANRMKDLKPSDIREVGKIIAQKTGAISFAGGLPAPELFPAEKLDKVTQRLLQTNASEALQYGPTLGYGPLRGKIAELMSREGVVANVNNICITAGSQQALSLTTMMFLNPGDTVIVENPSYLGAFSAFQPFEVNFMGVDTDDDGMDIEKLEQVIKSTPSAKLIYVIPNFQNPTGRTWTLERRKQLLAIANKYDIAIMEDNAYGELAYEGERIPSLKSLDTEGKVMYLGSFSKILCPGFRVGWICAEANQIEKFELLKYGADLQNNQFSQMQIYEFLNSYDLDEHIAVIKSEYKIRRDLMLKVIEEKFPSEAKYIRPNGGMFVWMELPEHVNTRELLVKSLEKNIGFVPGGSFYAGGECENALRLNFSNMDREKIVEGMEILAQVLRDNI